MTDLLVNWLNNEIELTKPIENLEKDFSNGYLFGELLFKFNQQANFREFSTKEDVPSKMENFKRLQPTFTALKVKYDTKKIDRIMKGDRGEAAQLLYQLKMQLEKVYPPTDIGVVKKTGKMGDNQPALKITPQRENFDAQHSKFFQSRLQAINKPQKQLNMEKHLTKYEEEKARQERIAAKANQLEVEAQEKARSEMRKIQINKVVRNAGFMEEWMQKGVEDWKKNQTIKKDRERRDLEFQYSQAEKFNTMTMKKIEDANVEVHLGIDAFENNLRNKGIEPLVSKQLKQDQTMTSGGSPMKGQKKTRLTQSLTNRGPLGFGQTTKPGVFTLQSTGLKSKDKKTVDDKTRKERERRRRKMIVDQSKTQLEMDQTIKENYIVGRMQRQSKQEQELIYEEWRTKWCKDVIAQNRELREQKYEKRRELDTQLGIMREEELLRQLKEQMDRDVEIAKERDEDVRIVEKQFQREKRTDFGNLFFDSIFDIADQAYIHLQDTDLDDIDDRNWREWIQLFINGQNISKTIQQDEDDQNQNDQNEEEQTEQMEDKKEKKQKQLTASDTLLTTKELEDYLSNKGQWDTSLVSENKPNLEAFLTGQTEGAQAPAKGKGGAKQAADAVVLEPGDTELTDKPQNNFFLGDAVEQVICLNHEAKAMLKRPRIPHQLTLKLCFVGYQFAGKQTQAENLAKEYNLDIYRMEELVDLAIEFSDAHPESLLLKKGESNKDVHVETEQEKSIDDQQEVNQAEDQEEQIENQEDFTEKEINNISEQVTQHQKAESDSEDSELDEDVQAEEDFRLMGLLLKEMLAIGDEITDELYVKLFKAAIRMKYPLKNRKELKEELKEKTHREHEICKRLAQLEALIEPVSEGVSPTTKRKQKQQEQYKQEIESLSKELEEITSLEKNGWVLVDFPFNMAQAKLLEEAISGFVPDQECDPINRDRELAEAAQLAKPNEKELPPKTLIKSGIDMVLWFEATRDECYRRAFGRRYDIMGQRMYHIEDDIPPTTSAPLVENLKPMEQDENCEGTLADRFLAFDQGRNSLIKWLKMFGNEDEERELIQVIDAEQSKDDVYAQIKNKVETILDHKRLEKSKKKAVILDKIREQEEFEEEMKRKAEEDDEKRRRKEEGQENQEEEEEEPKPEQKEVEPEQHPAQKATSLPSRDNLDNDFRPTLMSLWQELSSNYKASMKEVFVNYKEQRERVFKKLSHTQKQFLFFLHRPDDKQAKLDKFVKDFNEFSDEYPDLREDDQTKEELHQRLDILSDELWDIAEERKEQAVDERKKIMENGWIEHELSLMTSLAQKLFQAEVDKFKSSIQFIHDYYHAIEEKLIPEPPAVYTVEIDGDDLPEVEKAPDDILKVDGYTYPRVDKLFEKALKAQVVPDVIAQAQSAAAADKKNVKKDPKKKDAAEEDKDKEPSIYENEMKEAIKVEKSILRYRLTQIRNWAWIQLKTMREKTISIYKKMDDWIVVSNKGENGAIEEMCEVVREAIEEEQKIQTELRIKFLDFMVDKKIMNYIDPPPPKKPMLEEKKYDRFNIAQLRSLLEDLTLISGGEALISNELVVAFLMKKVNNSTKIGDGSSVPDEWKQFGMEDFQKITKNLDKYNTGKINWKILMTYICLLNSPIVDDNQWQAYEAQTGKGKVQQEQFVNASAWFDEYEVSVDRDYSIPYPRLHYLKEILFETNQEEGEVSMKKLGNMLKAKEILMFKKVAQCYKDLLFTL